MADFCKECSERTFGYDAKDLAGICNTGQLVVVLCEGCGGYIYVDETGTRVCHFNPEDGTE